MPSVDIRGEIVTEARLWLGTKFRHNGRTTDGIDCVGLVSAVFGAVLGQAVDGPAAYEQRPTSRFAFSAIVRVATRIDAADAGPGDVVQMRYGGRSVHFAILTPVGVIHSAANSRKVVEHAMPRTDEGQVVAYWRMKGVPAWRK